MDTPSDSKKENKKKNEYIRISIDGSWDVQDFSAFYIAFEELYKFEFVCYEAETLAKYIVEYKIPISSKEELLKNYYDWLPSHLQTILKFNKFESKRHLNNISGLLSPFVYNRKEIFFDYTIPVILKTQYASPGFTDLLGLGNLLKEIKELIFYYIPNKADKEKAEILKQEKISRQISNLKEMGFSDLEIRELILNKDKNLQIIQSLVKEGKITDADIKKINQ